MNTRIFYALLLLGTCLSIAPLPALAYTQIDDLEQRIFGPGEQVSISLELSNPTMQPRKIVVEVVFDPGLQDVSAHYLSNAYLLDSGESATIKALDLPIPKDFPAGDYVIVIRLFEDGALTDERKIVFNVRGTLRKPKFDTALCLDPDCQLHARVFERGEDVFIVTYNDQDHTELSGILISPSGKRRSVEVPSVVAAEEVGIYTLEIQAGGRGYSTKQKILRFAVSEQGTN